MQDKICAVKRAALLLLTPLLLSAACNQQARPPAPPPVLDPPSTGPIVWRYTPQNHQQYGNIAFWMKEGARGLEVTNYVQSLDGRHRVQWYGISPFRHEADPAFRPIHSLYLNEGYLIHYGLDTTPDRWYGGRKFYWKYRFRVHTNETPWRFEAPIGPVVHQVIQHFPWDPPGQTSNPRGYASWGRLNTAPVMGPFLGCLQQTLNNHRTRGIFLRSQHTTAVQWWEVGTPGPHSFTRQWGWVDGVYDAYWATTAPSGLRLTGRRMGALSNRTHTIIVVVYADGLGPHPAPWERRYWRLAGRGVGGFLNPDGSVRCEYGEWRLDELTEPGLVAWMDEWRTSTRGQPPEGPIDPRLVPEGW